jgi:hypothetical protein
MDMNPRLWANPCPNGLVGVSTTPTSRDDGITACIFGLVKFTSTLSFSKFFFLLNVPFIPFRSVHLLFLALLLP